MDFAKAAAEPRFWWRKCCHGPSLRGPLGAGAHRKKVGRVARTDSGSASVSSSYNSLHLRIGGGVVCVIFRTSQPRRMAGIPRGEGILSDPKRKTDRRDQRILICTAGSLVRTFPLFDSNQSLGAGSAKRYSGEMSSNTIFFFEPAALKPVQDPGAAC